MEIWLDSIDIDLIQNACDLGILHGVTTNPGLLSRCASPKDFIQNLLQIQTGPIAIQVLNQDEKTMLDEARTLHYFHPKIIIKVPVTREGLFVLAQLVKENIPTMATAVFTSQQFLLAALIGCDYVAPYLGRMEQHKIDLKNEINTMQGLIHHQQLPVKIIAAAIRDIEQLLFCATQGVKAITLSGDLFKEFIKTNTLTSKAVEQFTADWKKNFSDSSIF